MRQKFLQPRYGIDAPGVVRGALLSGIAAILAGALAPPFRIVNIDIRFVGPLLIAVGIACLTLFTSMMAYALFGKFRVRDRLLGAVSWRGDEQVLDVGTGRGLLLVGAAKRLTTGHVVGIDIWQTRDLSGNGLAAVTANVAREGVADRVALRTEDARSMSFADASFDVVLSLLCLHNIEDVAERERACGEIARVLKPGGTVVLGDYATLGKQAAALREAGLHVGEQRSLVRVALGPMWMVTANK